MDKWPQMLFNAAGIEKESGLGWHRLRRLWVTERCNNPLADPAVAGGWRSFEAMNRYIKTDEQTIERIIKQPPTRRSQNTELEREN